MFSRMSIARRLSLGFGLVITLLAIVAGTSLVRMKAFNASVEQFSSVRVPKLITAAAWVDSLLQSSRLMREGLLVDDEKQIKASLASVQKGVQRRADLTTKLEKMVTPGRETELFQAITRAAAKYAPHEAEFLTVAGKADYRTAKDIMLERVAPAQRDYQQAISAFSDYQVEQTGTEASSAHSAYTATAAFLLGLSAVAVAAGVAAAWLIIRGLVSQLRSTVLLFKDVAQGHGDLTKRLAVDTHDEVGEVGECFNSQGNASQTEELSATSQALAADARQLHELVNRFQLADRSRATRPAPPSAPRAPIAREVPRTPKPASPPELVVATNGHARNGHAAGAAHDGFEEF